MFVGRTSLDLTDFAFAILRPLEEEGSKRNRGIPYGGQRSSITSTMGEDEYQQLRRAGREKLKVELQLAITAHLEKGPAA